MDSGATSQTAGSDPGCEVAIGRCHSSASHFENIGAVRNSDGRCLPVSVFWIVVLAVAGTDRQSASTIAIKRSRWAPLGNSPLSRHSLIC